LNFIQDDDSSQVSQSQLGVLESRKVLPAFEIEDRRRFPETLDQRSGEGRLPDLSSTDDRYDWVSRQELLETFLVSMAINHDPILP